MSYQKQIAEAIRVERLVKLINEKSKLGKLDWRTILQDEKEIIYEAIVNKRSYVLTRYFQNDRVIPDFKLQVGGNEVTTLPVNLLMMWCHIQNYTDSKDVFDMMEDLENL